MDNETIEKKDAFTDALKALCREHNVTNASFCGKIEGMYYGYLSLDGGEKLSNILISVTNVGRLWQHARTSMRLLMDSYEGE